MNEININEINMDGCKRASHTLCSMIIRSYECPGSFG